VPLKFLGPYPTGDNVAVPLGYVNDLWNGGGPANLPGLKVDNAYVDAQTNALLPSLADVSYVDTRDSGKALKTAVDAADAAYIARSLIGQPNGPVPLNSVTQIDAAYVPAAIPTARTVTAAPDPVWALVGNQAVSTTNTKEYAAATITIADPGYPYLPIITGQATGAVTTGAADPGNGLGTGVWGQAIVFDTANNVWARAVTGPNFRTASYPLWPWAVAGATPSPLTGPTVLTLYLSLYGRSDGVTDTYTFTRTNTLFSAVLWAAL
jgi:hypothetical protein